MFSVPYQYTRFSLPMSVPQHFVCSFSAVFTHMSPTGPGLPRYNLGGGGLWVRAAAGVGWAVPGL
jgi:hypothetical protein